MSPKGVLTRLVLRFIASSPDRIDQEAICGGRQIASRGTTIALRHRGHNYARGKLLRGDQEKSRTIFPKCSPWRISASAVPAGRGGNDRAVRPTRPRGAGRLDGLEPGMAGGQRPSLTCEVIAAPSPPVDYNVMDMPVK